MLPMFHQSIQKKPIGRRIHTIAAPEANPIGTSAKQIDSTLPKCWNIVIGFVFLQEPEEGRHALLVGQGVLLNCELSDMEQGYFIET